jgi:predicted RNA binding protein YcfA (HicA-like mRNA interferase family)
MSKLPVISGKKAVKAFKKLGCRQILKEILQFDNLAGL